MNELLQLRQEIESLKRTLFESLQPKSLAVIVPSNDELLKFTLGADMGALGAIAQIEKLDGSAIYADRFVVNTLGHFSHLDDGEVGLCMRVGGKFYAVHPELADGGAGEGGGSVVIVSFTLTSDLTSTGTATVNSTSDPLTIDVGDSISLVNSSGKPAFDGATGVAMLVFGAWYVVEVDRPVGMIEAVFSSNSHDWSVDPAVRGFTADQISPITWSSAVNLGSFPVEFNQTLSISNPYNLNWKSGDRGLLRKFSATEYIVVKVLRQVCLRFRFKLTADSSGLSPNVTAVAVCPSGAESGPPPSGSLSLADPFNKTLNAKSGHYGIAEYDWNNDRYQVVECQHFARRIKGEVNATATPGDVGNRAVKNFKGMDGITTAGTTLTAKNR